MIGDGVEDGGVCSGSHGVCNQVGWDDGDDSVTGGENAYGDVPTTACKRCVLKFEQSND